MRRKTFRVIVSTSPVVTVVVPTYNRAAQLRHAIRSIQRQTHATLEILIVDDASTDGTSEIVRSIDDARIRYIRHSEKHNAAVARNTGVREARGEYIAFLDSDDEWLPHHVSHKVRLLQVTGSQGVFGSFYLAWKGLTTEYRCADLPRGMHMAEYILSSRAGDARTSTFVFESAALREVLFDDSLEKHQDWDLAIRFAERFSVQCDRESTVVINPEAERRMSYRMNHAATTEFLRRYQEHLTPRTLARAHALFARRTFQTEGRNRHFERYMRHAFRHWTAGAPRDRFVIAALALPGIDRLFIEIGQLFVRVQRRFRQAKLPGHG